MTNKQQPNVLQQVASEVGNILYGIKDGLNSTVKKEETKKGDKKNG